METWDDDETYNIYVDEINWLRCIMFTARNK